MGAPQVCLPEDLPLLTPAAFKQVELWKLRLLLADPGRSYDTGLTNRPGRYFGTRRYVAPEVTRDTPGQLSSKVVSYALGVMLLYAR